MLPWPRFLRVVARVPALLPFALAASAQVPPVPVPAENPITEEKRILGKILFWDEQRSTDHTTACGTCHLPVSAGADPRSATHPGFDEAFLTDDDVFGSLGVRRANATNAHVPDPVFGLEIQVTGRAAPSFFGALFAPALFWDGRATSAFTDGAWPSHSNTAMLSTWAVCGNMLTTPAATQR